MYKTTSVKDHNCLTYMLSEAVSIFDTKHDPFIEKAIYI